MGRATGFRLVSIKDAKDEDDDYYDNDERCQAKHDETRE